jgi:DNA-binding response OmpR family regulator
MKPKLLIVDDEEEIHKLIRRLFVDGSVEVVEAYNGQEGLKVVKEQSPQLVIMDINMPIMDGYQALRALRANPDTNTIPVMMFTSKGDMVDKVVGFELGVEDYLTKPVDVEELKRRVTAFFKR